MFWSMLIGEYHKPKNENRIFIFLDINESTSIAEDLGHTRYFMMLRRFFRDITLPIMANDGEIYQYVGDEVVLNWSNTPENKLKSLKFIRNTYFLIPNGAGLSILLMALRTLHGEFQFGEFRWGSFIKEHPCLGWFIFRQSGKPFMVFCRVDRE